METLVRIPSEIGDLEGIFDDSKSDNAIIITHPHPLYGGDMYNSVVYAMARAFKRQKFSTLRLNFRGVGNSSGNYDNGIGEQADVQAAVNFLEQTGVTSIDFAGYSFGAWVLYNYFRRESYQGRLFLVSPPVDFIEFEKSENLSGLVLTIAGENDEYASLDNLIPATQTWNPTASFKTVRGADHFYSGCTDRIIEIIEEHLDI